MIEINLTTSSYSDVPFFNGSYMAGYCRLRYRIDITGLSNRLNTYRTEITIDKFNADGSEYKTTLEGSTDISQTFDALYFPGWGLSIFHVTVHISQISGIGFLNANRKFAVEKTFLNYVRPTANVSVERGSMVDDVWTPDIRGNEFRVYGEYNSGSMGGVATVSAEVNPIVTLADTVGYTRFEYISSGARRTQSYTFTLSLTNRVETITTIVDIPTMNCPFIIDGQNNAVRIEKNYEHFRGCVTINGEDLNSIRTCGRYAGNNTVSNYPTGMGNGFTMTVSDSIGNGIDTDNYTSGKIRLLQTLTDLNGNTWTRTLTYSGSSWSAGNWKRTDFVESSITTTKGSWSWRKHSDGTAECWIIKDYTDTLSSRDGQIYYGAAHQESFPFTFAAEPACFISSRANYFCDVWQSGNVSASSTPKFYIITSVTQASRTYTVSIHAIGKVT